MARKGEKLSEETKAKISAAKKGVPNTPEHTAKIRKWFAENGVSEETRKKIAASRTGQKHTDETRRKISISRKNLFAAKRSYKWRNPKRP